MLKDAQFQKQVLQVNGHILWLKGGRGTKQDAKL